MTLVAEQLMKFKCGPGCQYNDYKVQDQPGTELGYVLQAWCAAKKEWCDGYYAKKPKKLTKIQLAFLRLKQREAKMASDRKEKKIIEDNRNKIETDNKKYDLSKWHFKTKKDGLSSTFSGTVYDFFVDVTGVVKERYLTSDGKTPNIYVYQDETYARLYEEGRLAGTAKAWYESNIG